MALLDTITQEVYALTKRPDLVTETALAIKSATLKAHRQDFFYRDLVESGINFGAANYLNSFDFRTYFPFWRAPKYLRKIDSTGTVPGAFIELLAPESVLDRYNVQKDDIYYIAGSVVQIKSSTQDQYYLVAYYSNPDVTVAGYNSWIAQEQSPAISFEAAAIIFKTIGFDEQEVAYRNLVQDEYAMLKVNYITADI